MDEETAIERGDSEITRTTGLGQYQGRARVSQPCHSLIIGRRASHTCAFLSQAMNVTHALVLQSSGVRE
jgi:hypothetical protein